MSGTGQAGGACCGHRASQNPRQLKSHLEEKVGNEGRVCVQGVQRGSSLGLRFS